MIARTLWLDLETDRKGEVISKAGLCMESLNGGMAWSWEKAQSKRLLEERLDAALFGAAAIAGHNVWRHDLRVLAKQFPRMALLGKLPVVDTLELSPLCFPKNPYHALEKDYKPTGREENDPLGDAVLARDLLRREVEALAELRDKDPVLHRALHGLCAGGSGRMAQGYALVFGGAPPAAPDVEAAARECAGRAGCATAAGQLEIPEDREGRMGLAYVLVWLTVAGDGRSVLPGWVWRCYPQAREIADRLRDRPCGNPGCAWCREQFDGRERLRRWFPGFEDFRRDEGGGSLQREVVEAALAGESLVAVMPTGGGKSLCFQLPALAKMERRGSLTVVLSPLQSLMKDQVDQLARRSPAARGCAAALNGLLTPLERRDVLHRIAMGDVSLLYVAPEQLRSKSFGQALRQREIGAWVFDEAHCLSKWGHDFRTDYLYAGRFIRERMGGAVPPVMYVTATAKSEVLTEIRAFHKAMTGTEELRLFEASVERPALQFEVMKVPPGMERMEKIADVLSERLSAYGRGGAIVFRSTRAKTEQTAKYLQDAGWKAAHFHAGLPPEEKKEVQDRFIAGDLQVIAATNAFGMGVDKEDVRVVIHGDMPGSIENYLQEAGRAGRDRRPADCILMYDEDDADWQFNLNGMNRLGRREIAELLRALRKYRRKDGEAIVVTVGELMQDTRLQEVFDAEDRGLNTKVKTALSWLERAEYLRRDDNVVSVFQAKPLVRTRMEAERKAAEAGEPPERQRLWGDIVNEFAWAQADDGIDADRLLELESLEAWSRVQPHRQRPSRLLFQELRAMSKAGLLRECTTLTAYVRHKVTDPSRARLARASRAAGLAAQTAGILEQVKQWRQGGMEWERMAVLGVQKEDVDAFRGLAEAEGIPFSVRMDSEGGRKGAALPPLWRMRECFQFLEEIKAKSGEVISREELEGRLEGIRAACGGSLWTDLLAAVVAEYPDKAGLAEEWTEHIHEALAASRRDGRVGRQGIWLSTVHAAKGTEHDGVIVAGRWGQRWREDAEEARRLLYVGMTRARHGLAIIDRGEEGSPLLESLRRGEDICIQAAPAERADAGPLKRYRLLGPADMDLSFSGRGDAARTARIAAALKRLRTGALLEWEVREDAVFLKAGSESVAMLSVAGAEWFRRHVERVEALRVLGVYGWRREDAGPEWRNTCVVERWGVPLCEAVVRAGMMPMK